MKIIISIVWFFVGFFASRMLRKIAPSIKSWLRSKPKKYRLQISRKTPAGQDVIIEGEIGGLFLETQYQRRPFVINAAPDNDILVNISVN
jgi:hypothetical protein